MATVQAVKDRDKLRFSGPSIFSCSAAVLDLDFKRDVLEIFAVSCCHPARMHLWLVTVAIQRHEVL